VIDTAGAVMQAYVVCASFAYM